MLGNDSGKSSVAESKHPLAGPPSAADRIVQKMKRGITAAADAAPQDVSEEFKRKPSSSSAPIDATFTSIHSQNAHEAMKRSLQISEANNVHGEVALQALGKQREIIQISLNGVEETSENLRQSRRVIRDMRVNLWKEYAVKAGVILTLIGIICVIVYTKWGHRRQ